MFFKSGHKILSSLLVITLLATTVPAYAAESTKIVENEITCILVENGYTVSTAEALNKVDRAILAQKLIDNPQKVDIVTVVLEVDNLAEIESFFSYTDEELIDMGANMTSVNTVRAELGNLYEKDVAEVAQDLNISETEAKMIHRAIELGKENAESAVTFERKSGVDASGSITTSEMTYTQSVTNNSTSTAPNYAVNLSYTWNSVYALAIFDDLIAAAWGGGLNTKNVSGTANYYSWTTIGGSYGSFHSSKSMNTVVSPQIGVEYYFPQNNNSSTISKTKTGSASFTLYQTKKQGYDSTLVSQYGHRVIAITDASVSMSPSGTGAVSLTISTAYDKTTQKQSKISY